MKYREVSMLDLQTEYNQSKEEIDFAISSVLSAGKYIGGEIVRAFEQELASYLDCAAVVTCGNGTDALQIALMSLNLKQGDEVIIPNFTYIAAIEVVCLLGLKPVLIDVDTQTFGITGETIAPYISERVKAIIVTHLFGQCIEMSDIVQLADKYDIKIIEDNAQSLGSKHRCNDNWSFAGTIGHIGCMSFFPSKTLGAFGDGGAICTNDDDLAARISQIARHGQSKKYYHEVVGVNSRLDAIQAGILSVKLGFLDKKNHNRQKIAAQYDRAFLNHEHLAPPHKLNNSTHIYGHYTLRVTGGNRDQLMGYLRGQGISCVAYYPLPIHRQKAYQRFASRDGSFVNSELLCSEVLSIPIHPIMKEVDIDYVIHHTLLFFNKI